MKLSPLQIHILLDAYCETPLNLSSDTHRHQLDQLVEYGLMSKLHSDNEEVFISDSGKKYVNNITDCDAVLSVPTFEITDGNGVANLLSHWTQELMSEPESEAFAMVNGELVKVVGINLVPNFETQK